MHIFPIHMKFISNTEKMVQIRFIVDDEHLILFLFEPFQCC